MIYYVKSDELYHHGIQGQRWGIRRYQNYDGSYTQAGMKRYNTAKDLFDRAQREYAEGKIDKLTYKAAKKNEKNAYRQLKKDKDADEGRKLREKGKTIAGMRVAGFGSIIAGGVASRAFQKAAAKEFYFSPEPNANKINALTAASVVSYGAGVVGSALASEKIRQMQAYDKHSSKYVAEGNKRVAKMLGTAS